MIVNNSLRKETLQETHEYAPITALEIKTGLILEKTLQNTENFLSDTLKDFKILSGISKALTLFMQEFTKRFDMEKPSLFTLSTQTFREFDHERGHVVEYRLLSVDKTG